jgi:hypothetical protein
MRLPSPTRWQPADRVDKLLRFRGLKATPSGFALPSCNSCKEIAIISLCGLGGSAMWIVCMSR